MAGLSYIRSMCPTTLVTIAVWVLACLSVPGASDRGLHVRKDGAYTFNLKPGRYQLALSDGEKKRSENVVVRARDKTTVTAMLAPKVPEGMVFIKGGRFQMGSEDGSSNEKPVHEVRVSDFYMGKYGVTVGEFRTFADATGYRTTAEKEGWAYAWTGTKWDKVNGAWWRKPGFSQTDRHPVVCVSWYDAVEYCDWLSEKQGLKPCYRTSGRTWEWEKNADGYRLPTEAEWEYACRAGTSTKYWWGNDMVGRHCNFADKSSPVSWRDKNIDDGYEFTAPVDAGDGFENPWGLMHMLGSVLEWCQDWYGEDYYRKSGSLDPAGPVSGSARVLRGGAWGYGARLCRSAFRNRDYPGDRSILIGFRVVLGAR